MSGCTFLDAVSMWVSWCVCFMQLPPESSPLVARWQRPGCETSSCPAELWEIHHLQSNGWRKGKEITGTEPSRSRIEHAARSVLLTAGFNGLDGLKKNNTCQANILIYICTVYLQTKKHHTCVYVSTAGAQARPSLMGDATSMETAASSSRRWKPRILGTTRVSSAITGALMK